MFAPKLGAALTVAGLAGAALEAGVLAETVLVVAALSLYRSRRRELLPLASKSPS